MLTHLSLFSGIGGLDLASEMAGFQTVGQCEWADYPTKVLEKHWPDVPRWRDIRTLTGESFYERTGLRTVDVVSGGFPCQPFSVAGKRRGKEDDRYLWPEMLRVIQEIRPRWVVGENVAGIVNMALDQVLSDLENIGYTCQTFIIPACAVDAAHRRDRCAIVSHCDTVRCGLRGSAREGVHRDTTRDETGAGSKNVADTKRIGLREDGNQSAYDEERNNPAHWEKWKTEFCTSGCGCSPVPDAKSQCGDRTERRTEQARWERSPISLWWDAEPDVGRVAHGVSHRVDRLRCLGNAVVPKQFYPLFRAIAEVEETYG